MVWPLLIAGAVTLVLGGCGEDIRKPAAVITMEKGGEFRIDFYPEDAPKTVENFVTLAKKGFYDGTAFSFANNAGVTQDNQSFLYTLDNTPAMDFLLP